MKDQQLQVGTRVTIYTYGRVVAQTVINNTDAPTGLRKGETCYSTQYRAKFFTEPSIGFDPRVYDIYYNVGNHAFWMVVTP
jgi:hypothetical protein